MDDKGVGECAGTPVEPPADPYHHRIEEGQRYAVRPRFAHTRCTRSHEEHECQTGDPCADVDDGASDEVQHGEIVIEQTATPDLVGHEGVDQHEPYAQKHRYRREPHELRAGT